MTQYIIILIFVLLTAGTFLLLKINPFQRKRYVSLSRKMINEKRKKIDSRYARLNWLEKQITRIDHTIRMCNSTRKFFLLLVLCSGVGGLGLGLFLFSDLALAVVTALCLLPAPYIFMRVRSRWYRRRQNEELENTLSIITNSYISCNDIVKAINDNLTKLDIYQPFAEFVADVTLVDSNVRRALRKLEVKINHPRFSEWIDIVILSQDQSSDMRYILPAVIDSMNDAKKLQIEADTVMAAVWREYFMAIGLAFSIIPLLKFSNAEWFHILIHSAIGRILLILMLIMTVVSAFITLKINKPIS